MKKHIEMELETVMFVRMFDFRNCSSLKQKLQLHFL